MNAESIRDGLIIGLSGVLSIILDIDFKVVFVLMLLMFLDIVIGVLFAIMNGNFVSHTMKKGLVMKVLILLLLLSLALFINILSDYGIEVPFTGIIGLLFCFNEVFSILETFAANDVILPKQIMNWFRDKRVELYEDEIV